MYQIFLTQSFISSFDHRKNIPFSYLLNIISMNSLLNRFAWLLSVSTWTSLSILLVLVNIMDDDFGFFFAIVFTLLIRYFCLWSDWINERVSHFAEALISSYVKPLINHWEKGGEVTPEQILQEEKINRENNNYSEEENPIELSSIHHSHSELPTNKEESNSEIKENILDTDTAPINKIASAYLEKVHVEKKEKVPSQIEIYTSQCIDYIKDFFATNTLAKIWWVLIFLAVIYFLKWVATSIWDYIWPVGRIICGFAVWFWTYFTWFLLEKKWSKNEGFILIGVGILINYGVTFSGRFLLGGDDAISEFLTFFLLLLNSVFAVISSLLYKSRSLLMFSFIFAYSIPFIIWATPWSTPYTLVTYSLILSLSWMILAHFVWKQISTDAVLHWYKGDILLLVCLVLWNILILVAPFWESIHWIAKILSAMIITASWWVVFSKKQTDYYKGSEFFICFAYIIILLHIFTLWWITEKGLSLYSFVVGLPLLLMSATTLLIRKWNTLSFTKYLLFVPLWLFGLLYLSWIESSLWSVLSMISILSFLGGFSLIYTTLSSRFSFIFFLVLALYLSVTNSIFITHNLDVGIFIAQLVIGFILLFSSYFFSSKKGHEIIYSIGTLGTIIILFPILQFSNQNSSFVWWELSPETPSIIILLSIISLVVFALSHWVYPFLHKSLIKDPKQFGNFMLPAIVWMFFLTYEAYILWGTFFPWIATWIGLLLLAIMYFVQAYIIFSKLHHKESSKQAKQQVTNIFLSFAAMSVSIFSLSIAFICSKYPEVISTVWLFEATILYYVYSYFHKDNNISSVWKSCIIVWANILFLIWVVNLGRLLFIVDTGDYMFLVSFSIIFASIIANIFFLDSIHKKGTALSIHAIIHYLLHIISIWLLATLLAYIIQSSWKWWSILWVSWFLLILWTLYSRLSSKFLPIFFTVAISAFSLYHLFYIDYIFSSLERQNYHIYKALQYVSSTFIISNIFVWIHSLYAPKLVKKLITTSVSIYAFLASNIYILLIFGDLLWHFSLTLYWWIIAWILLLYWISQSTIIFRTIGLYFLALCSAKIFFFDVWQIGNTNSRIIAFLVLGILFVIISTLYTKKFGNNILAEISPSNLKNLGNLFTKNQTEETIENSNTRLHTKNSVQQVQNTQNSAINLTKEDSKNTKKTSPKEITEESKPEENHTSKVSKADTTNELTKQLSTIDASNVKVVRFSPNNSSKFSIRAENLSKMVIAITKQAWKNNFAPWELIHTYNYIVSNYKTSLSRREYDKLRSAIKKFVDEWWSVEIIYR